MDETRPNIVVRPNIAVCPSSMPATDGDRAMMRQLPGDLLALWYPALVDVRTIETQMTDRQRAEYFAMLVCNQCRRPCGGTCAPRC